MNKCVFLDRDGVLNKDKVDYVYKLEDHIILNKVPEALKLLKDAGYLLVIITNQSGIAKGLYTSDAVKLCYDALQEACGGIIDGLYYAPYHPDYDSECLTRKPDSLMFEKAIAKFNVDVHASWMVGDKARDLVPAAKLGLKTILVDEIDENVKSTFQCKDLWEATEFILSRSLADV
ncbi:MAG TPA: HAD family hydrolase [Cytophagaceae bacterium]|jgi:D-glycero-D-manno-heptose 1,7-bisphosphate phosphatase